MRVVRSPAPEIRSPQEATGEYRRMLIRLITRQFQAETAAAEVFGRSIAVAPRWPERYLAAEFAHAEAQHSQMLFDLLVDLGEDAEAIIAARPPAGDFWGVDPDNWLQVVLLIFAVAPAARHQFQEYRQSSYRPWAERVGVLLSDEEEYFLHGAEILRRFAAAPGMGAAIQAGFDRMLPVTLKRAFGRPSAEDNQLCLRHGLKRHATEELVNRYLEEMRGHMKEPGLRFPPLSVFDAAGVELSPSTRGILESTR